MTDSPHPIIPPQLHGPADTLALGAILAAIFDQLPTILGIIGGLMGVIWYGVLFWDRFGPKKKNKDLEH